MASKFSLKRWLSVLAWSFLLLVMLPVMLLGMAININSESYFTLENFKETLRGSWELLLLVRLGIAYSLIHYVMPKIYRIKLITTFGHIESQRIDRIVTGLRYRSWCLYLALECVILLVRV